MHNLLQNVMASEGSTMSFEHLPGHTVIILNGDCKPVGEVKIECYLQKEKAYYVWWTYPQTGEKQRIKVPEWRLFKKRTQKKDSE